METIWQISSVLWFSGSDKEKKTAREGNEGEIYESRRHHRLWCLLWDRIKDVLFALGYNVGDLDWFITGSCATSDLFLLPAASLLPRKGQQQHPAGWSQGEGCRWDGRADATDVLGEGDMSLIKIIAGLHMKNKSTPCHKVLLPPQHLLFGVHPLEMPMGCINDWRLPVLCAERRVEVLLQALCHRTCSKCFPCHGSSLPFKCL